MKNIVGIIGNGFVGESQAFAFSPTNEIRIYDVDPLRSTHSKEETHESDFIFVCVQTPMDMSGKQDLSYIKRVFEDAKEGPIYIIKSTVLPGTTEMLQRQYPHLNIIFSPEFLTERTAKLDMLTQARVIFGGDRELTNRVEELFSGRFMNRHFIHTDSKTAEFIKYMNNTFFAAKVSLMNEYYRLAQLVGVNWNDALYGFASDGRVGDSHLHVPGPDGKVGFGGTCFPKDINALMNMAKDVGVNMNVLEAAWKTNLEVRPEQDWNKLKGRAISEKND
jgi:nucleotide sugar dehydrogenase